MKDDVRRFVGGPLHMEQRQMEPDHLRLDVPVLKAMDSSVKPVFEGDHEASVPFKTFTYTKRVLHGQEIWCDPNMTDGAVMDLIISELFSAKPRRPHP